MSYARRRYRRRRRPSRFKKWNRRLSTANKALKVAYGVKKLLNVEYKYFDDYVTNAAPTSATIYNLSEIPQGDGVTSRDGNQVKCVSIQFQMYLRNNTQSTRSCLYRVILFQVFSQDDTAPDWSDPEVGLLDFATIIAYRNLDGSARNRYKILKDWKVILEKDAERGDKKIYRYYKKTNFRMRFGSSSTGQPRKNSLYLLVIPQSVVGGYYPTMDYNIRLRYLDN